MLKINQNFREKYTGLNEMLFKYSIGKYNNTDMQIMTLTNVCKLYNYSKLFSIRIFNNLIIKVI